MGFPHCLHSTTADTNDREGAVAMIAAHAPNLPSVAAVLCDGGYTGASFAKAVLLLIGAETQIIKRNELHTFAVIPKRWIVERTFSWLEHYRRLWKNCERKIHTSLQMTTVAFMALLLKRWRY